MSARLDESLTRKKDVKVDLSDCEISESGNIQKKSASAMCDDCDEKNSELCKPDV